MVIGKRGDGKLGLLDLYCLGVGQVIGVGVVTLIGPAIQSTGWSVWLCYGIAVLYGFITIMPLVFITGTVCLTGGYYSLISGFTGNKILSGMYAIAQITKTFGISLYAVSLGAYLKSLLPDIKYIILIELFFLSFFFILNLFGMNVMKKFQNVMTNFLIAGLMLFIFWGLANYNNSIFDFSHQNFITNGVAGMWVATLSLLYSTTGYYVTMNFGAVARNPTRDVPKAMLLSVPTIMFLYVGVALADICVLPIEAVSGKPLTYTALAVFPKVLFYAFIIGGPIMAILTSMNATISAVTLPIVKACEDGWLPKNFASRNKYGIAWKIILIYWVIGLLPTLLGFNISTIINNIQLLNSFIAIIYIYAYWFLPTRFPEAWQKSKYHIPDNLYRTCVIVCFIFEMIILVTKAVTMSPLIVAVSTIVTIICFVVGIIRAKDPSIDIADSAMIWSDAYSQKNL